jgi:hypothetical protein
MCHREFWKVYATIQLILLFLLEWPWPRKDTPYVLGGTLTSLMPMGWVVLLSIPLLTAVVIETPCRDQQHVVIGCCNSADLTKEQ